MFLLLLLTGCSDDAAGSAPLDEGSQATLHTVTIEPQANGSTFDGRASVIPANTPVLASYCRTVELGIGSSPVVCGPAWQVLWKDGALCWSQAAMTSTEDAIASSCENLIPGDITLTLQWWE